MLLAKLRPLFRFVRQSRDISKNPPTVKSDDQTNATSHTNTSANTSRSDPVTVNEDFPYKFKGVRTYPADETSLSLLLPQERPFGQIYKNFLDAVNNRNERKLADLTELSLLKPLINNNINYSYINKDSSVKVLYNLFSIGVGVKFLRQKQQQYMKHKSPDNLVSMYTPKNLNPFNFSINEGIPILLSVYTTVLSKARLALPNDQHEQQQAHSVTFEYEGQLQMTDMMSMMKLMPSVKSSSDMETLKTFLYKQNKHWRIGNIDDFLKKRHQ